MSRHHSLTHLAPRVCHLHSVGAHEQVLLAQPVRQGDHARVGVVAQPHVAQHHGLEEVLATHTLTRTLTHTLTHTLLGCGLLEVGQAAQLKHEEARLPVLAEVTAFGEVSYTHTHTHTHTHMYIMSGEWGAAKAGYVVNE
jgi:hypothetical protein